MINKISTRLKGFWQVCLMLLLCQHLAAQQPAGTEQVTGTVLSEKGEFLIGVTVSASTAGQTAPVTVATDKNGVFVFKQLQAGKKYDFSFTSLGYENTFYKGFVVKQNGQKNSLLIRMKEDNHELDEVIVTGQGIGMTRRRMSTNVTTIKESELENIPSGRIDQLLQAKLPNAQIRLTGGQAGATSIFRARGVVSAFMNSMPIVYVDGVRMDNLNTRASIGGGSAQGAAISSLSDIPMDNIEHIEFINGGAATTLYGSDAANGVLQIFTKKSGNGQTAINLETQLGVETPTADFLNFKRTKDLLMENGFFQKYHVGLNGGTEKTGYSVSANFSNSSGVQIHNQNSNRKIDFSTGLRSQLSKKVTYESSFTYVNNKYKRNRNGNQGGYTGLWFLESGQSSIRGFDPMIDDLSNEKFEEIKAFVDKAERLQDNDITVNRFTSSQVFKYTPMKNLIVKATAGIDYRVLRDETFTTNEYLTATTGTPTFENGSITKIERKYLGITGELNAQHTWNTGAFSFVSTVGGQIFRTDDQQLSITGTNVRDGMRIVAKAAVKTSNENYLEAVNYGIYVMENIGYKNKLFLDLALRGDGNPAFGDNIGIQYYPKVGFSWITSSESWFQGLSHIVSSARLRGSFGVAGNLPTPYLHQRTVDFTGFNGAQAATFGYPGNPDMRPEKVQTSEIGVDLGFVKDRIKISAGYYYAKTKDALFDVPMAPSLGIVGSQQMNIGNIVNRGWEINTSFIPVQTKDFTFSVNASVNTLFNQVQNAEDVPPFNLNGFSARTIQTVVQNGYSVGFLRGGYGVFDANGVMQSTTAQVFLGNTVPDLFGSMGLNLNYKRWNVFANADYQKGAVANNWDRQFRFNYGLKNQGVPQAEFDKNKNTNWLAFSNMFIEKTDFIKVRTIGANYTFKTPSSVTKSIVLGFAVSNPLNFASSSFDPENTISGGAKGQQGATTGGISYATYSAPRQWIGTVRVQF